MVWEQSCFFLAWFCLVLSDMSQFEVGRLWIAPLKRWSTLLCYPLQYDAAHFWILWKKILVAPVVPDHCRLQMFCQLCCSVWYHTQNWSVCRFFDVISVRTCVCTCGSNENNMYGNNKNISVLDIESPVLIATKSCCYEIINKVVESC